MTPQQYELIGRLTIEFNEIDFSLEVYALYLVGAREFAMAERLSTRQEYFTQKAQFLSDVLAAILQEYPDLSDLVDAMKKCVAQAKQVAGERNRVVHGLLIHDIKRKRVLLRHKGVDYEQDEQRLARLLTRLSQTNESLAESFFPLHEALESKRNTAIASSN